MSLRSGYAIEASVAARLVLQFRDKGPDGAISAVRCSPAVADLPGNVQAFLRQYIDSVEQLEVLLLLRASGQEWTAEGVTRELATSLDSATARLDSLARSRLLATSDSGGQRLYRYDPAAQLVAAVDELAEVYPKRRVAVITFIFSEPDESLRHFSNAFRLRRKEK